MSRKKILILYYSQTGQLTEIINSITGVLAEEDDFELVYEEIRPRNPYPFPWTGKQFFQAFPESVQEIPCDIHPLVCNPDDHYDIVFLAYQIWFLSPSIPVNSFLNSHEAKHILKGKPVITVIGSRNMWVMAHERVRKMVEKNGGRLVGNIVLIDRAPNLISVVTIIRWLIKGRREGKGLFGKIFPRAGVSEKDITEASIFGSVISKALKEERVGRLQKKLVEAGAVQVNPTLVSIEKRGYMMFRIWSKLILRKGEYGNKKRDPVLAVFKYYLFTVIFLVSPIASAVFSIIHLVNRKQTTKLVRYYSGIAD
jgi:hypothetical protein